MMVRVAAVSDVPRRRPRDRSVRHAPSCDPGRPGARLDQISRDATSISSVSHALLTSPQGAALA